MIVLHRRGRTGEWETADLLAAQQLTADPNTVSSVILKNGEFAIEERDDGSRYVKIGDGHTLFKDLPYIDKRAEAKAVEEVQKAKTALQEALDKVDAKHRQLTVDTKVDLLNKINDTSATLETDYLAADSKVMEDARQIISKEIESLENKIIEDAALIDTTIAGLSINLSNLDSRLVAEKSAREAADRNNVETLSTLVDNKTSELRAELEAVDTNLAANISNVEQQSAKAVSNILKQLEAIGESVRKLSQTDGDLTSKIYEVSNNLSSIASQLSNELSVLETQHSIAHASVLKEIKNQEDARISSDQEIVSAMLEYITKIYLELADLVDDDILILEKAFSVENSLKAKIKALEETFVVDYDTVERLIVDRATMLKEELEEKFTESITAVVESVEEQKVAADLKFEEHYGLITELTSEFDETRVEVETQLTNINLAIDATKDDINNITNELKVALNETVSDLAKTVEALESATDLKFAEHQEALAELDTDVQTVRTDLEAQIVNIGELVETNKTDISNTVNTINKLEEDLTATIEELTEDVAAMHVSINQEISSSHEAIANIETEIQTTKADFTNKLASIDELIESNKAEADEHISSLNEQLSDVSARVDDNSAAIELQAERLNNLVSYTPDGTVKDVELVDIRIDHTGHRHDSAGDAVRAVGKGLVDLEESLSQYIGTQAVTGLHYDITGEVGLQQPYMLYLKAGEEIIQDSGVQVVGGSGGGGTATSDLSISYITNSPLVVTPADRAILYFIFSGKDSSGDIINQASATWKVNGLTVEHSTVKDGINEFDATKYISIGTTKVFLTVTDDNGSVVTKSWNIQQIELTIESSFNDKRKYAADEPLIFDYIPTGAVEKTVVFKLDGNEIDRVILGKEVSGSTVSYELPSQAHGAHLLEVYLEAVINDEIVPSNHILKDILWYDNTSTLPVIGTVPHDLTVKQYSTTNIVYTVYDPLNETPVVKIKVDDTLVLTQTVTPNKDYDNTTTAIYSYTTTSVGAHVIKIICGDAEKVINVFVENIGVTITPVTAGLAFDFNPVGKSNGTEDRLWSYNDVHMTVSSNFDWINGGYIPDDPDGPCFCIKAGSWAEIDYQLFANEAKVYGKEFKLIFKTKNVSNPDAIFLSCIDNTTEKDHIGLTMGAHEAHVYGKNGALALAYSEEDAIEFEFNISKDTEAIPMVMGYEDGVPSRPMVYDGSYSFKQGTPKVITLGSPDCDLYIYRFKVYNTSLSNSDILKNFIADARTADEMISRYNRNQIYDENNMLTAESVAARCPWLRVYKISAPHFTNNKSDKVPDTTIQQIYLAGDPVLDNWVAYKSQHSGQGTSSNNYGAAGRNLDFIMNKSSSYFELGDGSTTDKITLTRESVPVAYLNAKVNIASSNNLTNALLANRYNRFNPYRRPFVRGEGVNTDFIKDTMEFHNCVIFIQETDPDLSTHREFADTDWHFYAIGNIGDSKKTDNTRLTDQSDPYECCVEIMDVDKPLSAFPRDTMMNAMSFVVDEKTEEKIYTWAKDENLGILYEKRDDGSYVLTSDTTVDFNKTYYVDILLHDDFSEDYTYGWRYISDDEDADIVDFCKQRWIEFYRFVTESSDEEFKANLKDYFVVDSALYYYLFTTRYCMVDNRAKNTFWHYSKTANGSHKWDLCWDYDNDTSLGLNNYGKQLYRYGLEDIDFDEAGTEVFRQSDSLFFCRIRDLFGTELKKMYQDLESRDAWKASTLIRESDTWQEQFPEELWRIDIERKYIRTYTKSFINSSDKQFLVNMANGRMKYHRRQWERNQEQYMASKYQTTAALSEAAHANFRVNRFESTDGMVIKPNYQFTLTPYSYIYLNVYYNSGSPISVRAVPNVPTVVPYTGTQADIINVGSAAAIRDFGDLSALYPDTVSVQNAIRARTLKIGNSTEGYQNNGFSSLTTGANGLLEELDITNITSFDSTLDLKELINLKRLLAFGTSTPSVTFAEGGKIEYAELPALNDLTLKNLSYLSTNNLKLSSYNYVVDLTVLGCPLLNQLILLESCTKLKRAKLDNINFGTKTYEYFENNIFVLGGVDEGAANAQITGTVHFESLTGAQFNVLKARYPHLTITYDLLTSTITFKDTDLESTVYEQIVLNAGDCEDPSIGDGWTAPVMTANQEFRYEWFGWSKTPNILLNYELLDADAAIKAEEADYNLYRILSIKHVEGDRTLYPVFKVVRQQYEVQFINPTDNNRVLYSVMVPYGFDTTYVGDTPQKLDSLSPEIYEFTGWYPRPENIIDTLYCYAQFVVKDQDRLPSGEDDGDTLPGYTIGWLDITNCYDNNGNVFNGYTLNTSAKTMSITKCNNNLNIALRVPEALELDGTSYTITSLGGFAGNKKLELIYLPDTIKTISAGAFSECASLNEITFPSQLTTIGTKALENCTKITKVQIPANVSSIANDVFTGCPLERIEVSEDNAKYEVVDDCLLQGKGLSSGKILLKGLSTGIIPNDGTVSTLAPDCFYGTAITEVYIPDSITVISSRAFRLCNSLTTLRLPDGLKVLDSSCFSTCTALKDVTLPDTVETISTYAFAYNAIDKIVIPAATRAINSNAFGSLGNLTEVTFMDRRNAAGDIIAPDIDKDAFANSGVENGVLFNVPWSMNYDYNKTETQGDVTIKIDPTGWGAKKWTVYYSDGWRNSDGESGVYETV